MLNVNSSGLFYNHAAAFLCGFNATSLMKINKTGDSAFFIYLLRGKLCTGLRPRNVLCALCSVGSL